MSVKGGLRLCPGGPARREQQDGATSLPLRQSTRTQVFPFDQAWAPSVDASSLAPQLFAMSLFPYLCFLFFLTKSGKTPRLTLFGFYFLLVFVGATIPAGIYAKTHFGTSLANVDWLHGAAESLLTVTNLLVVLGLRQGIREAEAAKKAEAEAGQQKEGAAPEAAAAETTARRGTVLADRENPETAKYRERYFNFYDERLMGGAWSSAQDPATIEMFFRLLAVCHTVIPDGPPEPDKIKYEAESPDEAALVVAAKVFGFFFFKRTNTTVTVRERTARGEQDVEYEVLNILEFNSTRKRMSVVIKEKSTEKIIIFTKGADTVIYERLDPSYSPNEAMKGSTGRHMEEFGAAGLRTLCLSYAEVDREWYASTWLPEWVEAKTSLQDRDAKVAEVSEKIERNLRLLGCTAIEDKLQEGVPECIRQLAMAGIRIWVLTGDKMETAINIGFACSLLTEEMHQFAVSAASSRVEELERAGRQGDADALAAELVAAQLEKIAASLDALEGKTASSGAGSAGLGGGGGGSSRTSTGSGGGTPAAALVIDGRALSYALSPRMSPAFLAVGLRCRAVVCCRVSPLQKAQVTALVRSSGAITLAVGDGANDVGMIQRAHIGVGISGQEGMQAVMSADFAIAQFRFLVPLLLVHGQYCYKRITRMINFFFYKNMLFAITLFTYSAFTTFSGSYVYNGEWVRGAYGVLAWPSDEDIIREMGKLERSQQPPSSPCPEAPAAGRDAGAKTTPTPALMLTPAPPGAAVGLVAPPLVPALPSRAQSQGIPPQHEELLASTQSDMSGHQSYNVALLTHPLLQPSLQPSPQPRRKAPGSPRLLLGGNGGGGGPGGGVGGNRVAPEPLGASGGAAAAVPAVAAALGSPSPTGSPGRSGDTSMTHGSTSTASATHGPAALRTTFTSFVVPPIASPAAAPAVQYTPTEPQDPGGHSRTTSLSPFAAARPGSSRLGLGAAPSRGRITAMTANTLKAAAASPRPSATPAVPLVSAGVVAAATAAAAAAASSAAAAATVVVGTSLSGERRDDVPSPQSSPPGAVGWAPDVVGGDGLASYTDGPPSPYQSAVRPGTTPLSAHLSLDEQSPPSRRPLTTTATASRGNLCSYHSSPVLGDVAPSPTLGIHRLTSRGGALAPPSRCASPLAHSDAGRARSQGRIASPMQPTSSMSQGHAVVHVQYLMVTTEPGSIAFASSPMSNGLAAAAADRSVASSRASRLTAGGGGHRSARTVSGPPRAASSMPSSSSGSFRGDDDSLGDDDDEDEDEDGDGRPDSRSHSFAHSSPGAPATPSSPRGVGGASAAGAAGGGSSSAVPEDLAPCMETSSAIMRLHRGSDGRFTGSGPQLLGGEGAMAALRAEFAGRECHVAGCGCGTAGAAGGCGKGAGVEVAVCAEALESQDALAAAAAVPCAAAARRRSVRDRPLPMEDLS
ncbi:hypothetical protein GPECTOR_2g966 [Gonium pectorale]|uniref:Phospholipid-transporting ATPase n=1 Tax=Gonium pectorale TaxID=33097 RepID=A0A150H1Z6_GONPE|nr:hypothetical protein GPECTOR_2g966 [Gonium pectorale]|eukprot:KXZ56084.1 hypothetical protein GPECTOR_2g966 [Gonium pectorale]